MGTWLGTNGFDTDKIHVAGNFSTAPNIAFCRYHEGILHIQMVMHKKVVFDMFERATQLYADFDELSAWIEEQIFGLKSDRLYHEYDRPRPHLLHAVWWMRNIETSGSNLPVLASLDFKASEKDIDRIDEAGGCEYLTCLLFGDFAPKSVKKSLKEKDCLPIQRSDVSTAQRCIVLCDGVR